MSTKIRIIKPGIYGLPLSDDNTTGEYPIGHEMTIEGDILAGWLERVEIVSGGKAKKDDELIVNPADADEDDKPARRGRPPKDAE